MSDNFDAALKTSSYPTDVETGPVMGTPAVPSGYQGQAAFQAQGYPVQAGYPTQGWPAGVPPCPPGYGSGVPVYGGHPGMAYPYPPPPLPVGGGPDDEKFQISDVGMCTIVPGLEKVKLRVVYMSLIVMFLVLGVAMMAVALWLIAIGVGVASVGLWVATGLNFFFAVMFALFLRKNKAMTYPRITEESIAAVAERVTRVGATLPQINAVRALMSQANPNTPHEFHVWKSAMTTNGTNIRSVVVAASFGVQNLPAGQKAQLHLYSLQ